MDMEGFGDQKHSRVWQRSAVAVLVTTALLALAPQVMANAYPTSTPSSAPVCHDGAPATVSIDAGTVTNTTTLDLSADGGTSVGDSSGGDDNLATIGDGAKKDDHGKGNGKGKNHNKKVDDTGEEAAAGNGGVSDASADGGAVAVQDVNSGGNVGSAIAVGDTWGAGYDACGNPVPAVNIVGGTVTNQTTISVSADGGTAIADASGGDHNVASAGGQAGNGGSITSSAGNGGVSNASADGGAISIGDINSGGNAGNAIGIGNTVAGPVPICCATPPLRPGPGKTVPGPALISTPGKVVVVSLPSTGSGMALAGGTVAAALMALAAGAASVATRRRTI